MSISMQLTQQEQQAITADVETKDWKKGVAERMSSREKLGTLMVSRQPSEKESAKKYLP